MANNVKNKLQDLRNHLFDTLERLTDAEKPMEIDRAKAIAQVAGKLIDSAKIEVKYLELTGQENSGEFFPAENPADTRKRVTYSNGHDRAALPPPNNVNIA